MNKLIRCEVTRCQPASLQENLLYILLYVLCLHFLTHHDYFFPRDVEIVQTLFLSGATHTSVTFILPVLCLEYVCFQIKKLEFFVSWTTSSFYAESKKKALQEYSSFCCWAGLFWYVHLFFLKKQNLIGALHPGRNAFLFYFYIYIKFTLSKII